MKGREPDKLHLDVGALAPDEAVNRIIEHAADLPANDVFLTTNENHVAISARHLGITRLLSVVPLELGRRCMAHIKSVCAMDVAEKRRPLDGRCVYQRTNGSTIDLLVSTLPTLHGEDFTLRLIERHSRLLSLDELGLPRRDHNQLLSLLNHPSGLILVTGPTGAGKTTTLYACLSYLNNGERKIHTIEDPVECALPGVRQSQVNPKIDLDFSELLRGVLRQTPDVILVGEVRDAATAATVVRAANSGHLVLAALHAPVAVGAIQTLLSLDVPPHFLATSLLAAISQRLVRTLCPKCRVPYDIADSPQTFDGVRQWLEPGEGQTLYGPGRCDECHRTGYSGRSAVFEVLPVSKAIRRLIHGQQPTQAVLQRAREEGMIEFRHAAMLQVARGRTSIEEVFRTFPGEHLGMDE